MIQAKILYKVPFLEDEKQNIKILIQKNLYKYIGILLEGRTRFKEDHVRELRRQRADEPGPSGKHLVIDLLASFNFGYILELCNKHPEILPWKLSPFSIGVKLQKIVEYICKSNNRCMKGFNILIILVQQSNNN